MAPCPISYQEIEAYSRLMRLDLSPWEIETICRLDNAALHNWSARQKRQQHGQANGPPAEIPVDDTTNMKALFKGLVTRKKGAGKRKG